MKSDIGIGGEHGDHVAVHGVTFDATEAVALGFDPSPIRFEIVLDMKALAKQFRAAHHSRNGVSVLGGGALRVRIAG